MIKKLRAYLRRLGKKEVAGILAAVMLLSVLFNVPPWHATAQTGIPPILVPNPPSYQIAGLNTAASFPGIGAYTTCTMTVSGTWSGTLTFEVLPGGGSGWVPINGQDFAAVTSGTSTQTNVTWNFGCAGALQIRARFSAYSSGTANVAMVASIGNAVAGASSGGGSGGTQNVTIVSPNPLVVDVNNTPAPIAIPSVPTAAPAAVPWNFDVTGCQAFATPTPTSGQVVADQCNQYGHKIVGIEPNTTLTMNGDCPNSTVISDSSSGYTQLVALVSNKQIYVCAFSFQSAGTVNVYFAQGTTTTTACDTNESALTGAYPEVANSGIAMSSGLAPLFSPTTAGYELCINLSGSVGVYGFVNWGQF